MRTKTRYKIYAGDFPDPVEAGLHVKKGNGDYVNVDTGTTFSGATYNEVKVLFAQVYQIVDPSLLGVNQNYQDAKVPFIGCFIEVEELELYDSVNKIYYCADNDTNFHESEFDKIDEIDRNAVEI